MVRARGLAVLIAATFVAFACGGSTGSDTSKGEISIGVDLPISGAEGSQGLPTLNGVKYAVQQKGSVSGFKLTVDAKDDSVNGTHDAQKGAQNVRDLISNSKVLGMIGPFNSSVARAEIPITNAANLTMISPANTNQCLTKNVYIPTSLGAPKDVTCKDAGLPSPSELRPNGKNNYFRVPTTDDLQGPALADYLFDQLKLTSVAVLSDNEVYGKGIADTFAARFVKKGGKVVGRQDFDAKNTNDFKTFLQRFKSAGAQAVFFGGVTANKGCVIRNQMAGIFDAKTPFLGGDGIAQDPTCVKDAGSNNQNIYGAVATVDPSKVPAAAASIAGFQKAYPKKEDYGSYTILAMDATNILIAAIDRAIKANGGNMPTRDQVRIEVAKTSNFAGATGTITFDANGDTSAKIVSIYQSPTSGKSDDDWAWVSAVDFGKTPLT
jgi:branched-chain amino acid transport system substrate-binding protein